MPFLVNTERYREVTEEEIDSLSRTMGTSKDNMLGDLALGPSFPLLSFLILLCRFPGEKQEFCIFGQQCPKVKYHQHCFPMAVLQSSQSPSPPMEPLGAAGDTNSNRDRSCPAKCGGLLLSPRRPSCTTT